MKSEQLWLAEDVAVELSRDLIEKALEKVPTGGNAKPFAWQWLGSRLHVSHDVKLAEHYLNCNNNASKISLGCLIASVEIAARAQGFQAHVKLGEQLGAEIAFTPAKAGPANSYEINRLYQRSTYRGPMTSSLPPNVDMLDEGGIQVRMASAASMTSKFKDYLLKTDFYLWLQKKAMLSFFNEIRFFDDRFEPRGIRSKDLGVDLPVQMMLYFFSFVPWLLNWIIRIPLLNFTFVQASKLSQKNAHFVLITASELDSLSLVRAGHVAMKTWLDLEAQGYKVQPYSNASMTVVAAQTGQLPDDTLPRYHHLFKNEAPEIMRQQFQLDDGEQPVWMLRVGKPTSEE